MKYDCLTNIEGAGVSVHGLKTKVIPKLKQCIMKQFESFHADLFKSFNGWLLQIGVMKPHTSVPLHAQSFDNSNLEKEWKLESTQL